MQGKHLPGKRVAQLENKGMGFFGKAALILLVTAAVAVAGAAAGVGIYANHVYEGVFPGVSVAGIALDGQSLPGAQSILTQHLAGRLENSTVTVRADGETLGTYSQAQLGAHPHAAEAALKAYSVGREKGAAGWISNAVTMVRSALGNKTDLTPSLTYDEEQIRAAVEEMAADFDQQQTDASYEIAPDGLYATKERDGRTLNRDALAALLRGAEGSVEAPWTKTPGEALDLEKMAAEISAEPLPARYDIASGKVLAGQIGISVDTEAARYVMDAAAQGERIKLPADVVYPEMSAEELEAVLFRDLLSTASTTVTGTATRKNNVKLSGEFVNGTVLNDGDVFDYNAIVGERTQERGFGAAAAYRNGETVQEIGGGICQTSSTIYYAVLLADLEIVSRANHRFYPGYIELGMDATVSWGGPEFRWRNNTGYPVRVEVIYEKNILTVNIYGTKTNDNRVEMTHEVLSVTPYNTVYQETMDLMWGTETVKQSGYTGYKVTTYRNVYDGEGNLISSEVEAKSTYHSRDKIVLVGINGRPPEDTGSVETGGGTDVGGEETSPPEDGSGEGDDPVILDPEDEMPEWLRT